MTETIEILAQNNRYLTAENTILREALETLGNAVVMGSKRDVEKACLNARKILYNK